MRGSAVTEVIFESENAVAPRDVISVAVSLFNYERFIAECLSSIAGQNYSHLELIVVDDHSERDRSVDVSLEWMREHSNRFSRTLLLRHLQNQGLAEARNTAFRHAHGDCVFVIDADNVLYPRAISRLSDVLRRGGFGGAYSQLEFFGDQQSLGHADIWDPEQLKFGNYIDAMALISKEAWERVGGYTHMDGWEDYEFWCKFVENGIEAAYVPEILCRYRVHGSSMMRTETIQRHRQIHVDITLAHPWLKLNSR